MTWNRKGLIESIEPHLFKENSIDVVSVKSRVGLGPGIPVQGAGPGPGGVGVPLQWGPSWTGLNISVGRGGGGVTCMVRSNAWRMGNGHTGSPPWTEWLTYRHNWKHTLPATSLDSGKNESLLRVQAIAVFCTIHISATEDELHIDLCIGVVLICLNQCRDMDEDPCVLLEMSTSTHFIQQWMRIPARDINLYTFLCIPLTVGF